MRHGTLAVASLPAAFKNAGSDPIWIETKWKENKQASRQSGKAGQWPVPLPEGGARAALRGKLTSGGAAASLSNRICQRPLFGCSLLGNPANLLCVNPGDPAGLPEIVSVEQTLLPCPQQKCPCLPGKALATAAAVVGGVTQAGAFGAEMVPGSIDRKHFAAEENSEIHMVVSAPGPLSYPAGSCSSPALLPSAAGIPRSRVRTQALSPAPNGVGETQDLPSLGTRLHPRGCGCLPGRGGSVGALTHRY